MTIHLFDRRASPLVNLIASETVGLRNRLIAECGDQPIDMRKLAYACAKSILPLGCETEWRGLAYESAIVIQQALALDRAVGACREMAA
jgi:hypothetical protein